MITILSAFVSLLSFRVRSRASLERLHRVWPQVLNAMVLVKPVTVIQWHRKGYRLYWRRQSRRLGRPKMNSEIRDLIRQMSVANPLWGAPPVHAQVAAAANDLFD